MWRLSASQPSAVWARAVCAFVHQGNCQRGAAPVVPVGSKGRGGPGASLAGAAVEVGAAPATTSPAGPLPPPALPLQPADVLFASMLCRGLVSVLWEEGDSAAVAGPSLSPFVAPSPNAALTPWAAEGSARWGAPAVAALLRCLQTVHSVDALVDGLLQCPPVTVRRCVWALLSACLTQPLPGWPVPTTAGPADEGSAGAIPRLALLRLCSRWSARPDPDANGGLGPNVRLGVAAVSVWQWATCCASAGAGDLSPSALLALLGDCSPYVSSVQALVCAVDASPAAGAGAGAAGLSSPAPPDAAQGREEARPAATTTTAATTAAVSPSPSSSTATVASEATTASAAASPVRPGARATRLPALRSGGRGALAAPSAPGPPPGSASAAEPPPPRAALTVVRSAVVHLVGAAPKLPPELALVAGLCAVDVATDPGAAAAAAAAAAATAAPPSDVDADAHADVDGSMPPRTPERGEAWGAHLAPSPQGPAGETEPEEDAVSTLLQAVATYDAAGVPDPLSGGGDAAAVQGTLAVAAAALGLGPWDAVVGGRYVAGVLAAAGADPWAPPGVAAVAVGAVPLPRDLRIATQARVPDVAADRCGAWRGRGRDGARTGACCL